MTDLNAQVTVTPPSTRRPDDAPVETVSRVRASDIIGPAVVFVLFIGFWYALSTTLLPEQKRFLLPTPHKVRFALQPQHRVQHHQQRKYVPRIRRQVMR